MLWERPQMKFLKRNCIDQGENLQHIEIPIKGMEMALTCISCPVSMMGEELREVSRNLEVHIGQKFKQAEFSMPFDATASERRGEFLDRSLWKFHNISITQEELPVLFFFYCVELLLDDSPGARIPKCDTQNSDTEESSALENQTMGSFNRAWSSLDIIPTNQSLVFAFKCSLSLGLAVLFGLIYSKENGYWSGLTIAISFVTGRQLTFTVANARAQGTTLGSVYGILCCNVFQRFEDLRFMLLLPWIVFTNFLMHSRMYGKAGGISAVIGALLILGRNNYGRPSEFAIARITEACIGLICFLIVEILLNPARAATLAKTELSRSLEAFQDWINVVPCSSQKNMQAQTFLALKEKQNKLKSHVNELEKFIGEAELEPNFWFLPFHGSCYGKLLMSLSKMVDLLPFLAYQIEFLSQATEISRVDLKELQGHMNNDLELFKKKVSSSLECLKKVNSIKTLVALEKELQKKIISHDIELGKSPNENAFRLLGTNEEEVETIVSPFLQHLNEEVHKIYANEGEDMLKVQTVLCLGGLGFCISSLIRETMEIEKEVKELLQWENPSSHVNWNEISCKINALCT